MNALSYEHRESGHDGSGVEPTGSRLIVGQFSPLVHLFAADDTTPKTIWQKTFCYYPGIALGGDNKVAPDERSVV